MKQYCDRIRKEVEVVRKGSNVTIQCRYFKMTPKGPACKRILFGKIGFPNPTPMSAGLTISKIIMMGFFDAIKINMGLGRSITWHCPLYIENKS